MRDTVGFALVTSGLVASLDAQSHTGLAAKVAHELVLSGVVKLADLLNFDALAEMPDEQADKVRKVVSGTLTKERHPKVKKESGLLAIMDEMLGHVARFLNPFDVVAFVRAHRRLRVAVGKKPDVHVVKAVRMLEKLDGRVPQYMRNAGVKRLLVRGDPGDLHRTDVSRPWAGWDLIVGRQPLLRAIKSADNVEIELIVAGEDDEPPPPPWPGTRPEGWRWLATVKRLSVVGPGCVPVVVRPGLGGGGAGRAMSCAASCACSRSPPRKWSCRCWSCASPPRVRRCTWAPCGASRPSCACSRRRGRPWPAAAAWSRR